MAGTAGAVNRQACYRAEGGRYRLESRRVAGGFQGETTLLLPRIDRYRRPYEGTDNTPEAMQAYLDWEYGLVAQLDRDGTHGFNVLTA